MAMGVRPPSPQPCHLLSQTAQALPLRMTPSDLPVQLGRSCHLLSSLNPLLASFYKCVFVPVLLFSFSLFFFSL